jgi:oxygen-independent coproporphyrinogen III oxidase
MAGIYIHIPYCRQACRYCDFHFVVSTWQKNELIPYLIKELEERKDYLGYEIIDTIYFGGGTPSVMEIIEVDQILESIFKNYAVSEEPEISFEANPEDLNREYLDGLRKSGINRLSIGIQSFEENDLEFMHRVHDSKQALKCIKVAQDAGFSNISIDLIYGIPRQEEGSWERNLEKLFSLGIKHFSAYHLNFEPGTIFDHWRKKGRIQPIPEDESLRQFKYLISTALQNGFEHYEISNFARSGYRSRHNSSYWNHKKYLGIGPAAHSYDLNSRRWNIRNNGRYMENMKSGKEYFEFELLSENDKYNEYLMTSLRTSDGADYEAITRMFGEENAHKFELAIKNYLELGKVKKTGNNYSLTEQGIFIADHIISELFV